MILRDDYPTYIYLHSDDANKVITNWDKANVEDYKGDKNLYLDLDASVGEYYEISEEEHFEIINKQDNAHGVNEIDLMPVVEAAVANSNSVDMPVVEIPLDVE